jgi:hypothetical protein
MKPAVVHIAIAVWAFAAGTPLWGAQPTVENMVHAWRLREQRVVSAQFHCSAETVHTKESFPPFPKPVDEDLRYTDRSVLFWLDGKMMRYEYELPSIDLRRQGKPPARQVIAFDGAVSADLQSGLSGDLPAIGLIRKEARFEEMQSMMISPILYWCRGLHPQLLTASELTLRSERPIVDGRTCMVVAIPPSKEKPKGVAREFWVDPAREFILLRWAATQNETIVTEVNISYQADATYAWAPAAWSAMMFAPNGTLLVSRRVKVTDWSANAKFKKSDFQLSFPPDTMVNDWRTNKQYLVLADGTQRIVTAAEREQPFVLEQLRNTKSGEAAQPPGYSWEWWIFPGLAAGIVALLLYLFLRLRRSHA